MLQCQIWGRGTGNVGKWEALKTRGTGGKDRNVCHSIPAAGFSPVFVPIVAGWSQAWYKVEIELSGGLVGVGWKFWYRDIHLLNIGDLAPSRDLGLTPELRSELSRPVNFRGHGLVQCVSNDVFFCTWHFSNFSSGGHLQATHWVFLPAFSVDMWRKNKCF